MTKRGKQTEIAELRGPLNGLVVDFMRKNNIENVRDFADLVGVGRSTIYDLLRGRTTTTGEWMKPSLETLVRVAAVLGKPAHELLYLIDPSAPGADIPLATEVAQVPVAIAGRAGAGPDQDYELDGYTYVDRDFANNRDLIAFRIAGNSMAGGKYPIYKDDLVIVDRNVAPEINSAAVVRLKDDGYVCKRLRPGNILDSTNPEYLDPENALIAPDRVAEVVGKVVRIYHMSV